ncbi:hypothetical protein [Streptomyces canus]|uniref:hypothetical protein n=1 Tax=Streptomyces canus TaxID=58343 RepID=UPI0038695866
MTNEWNRRGFVGTTAAVAEAAAMAGPLSACGTVEQQQTGANTASGRQKALPVHAHHPPTWRNANLGVGQLGAGSPLADPTTYLSGVKIKKCRNPAAIPTGTRQVAVAGTTFYRHDSLEPRGITPDDVTSTDGLAHRPGATGFLVQNEGATGPLLSLPRSSERSVPEDASVVVLCPEQRPSSTLLPSLTPPSPLFRRTSHDLAQPHRTPGRTRLRR